MMVAVFAALLCAFVAGWFGRERLAAACIAATFVLAVGLFLYEIYSPEYGFRMPWIRTHAVPGPMPLATVPARVSLAALRVPMSLAALP